MWARAHRVAGKAGTYRFSVTPTSTAAFVAAHPRDKVKIRLWVSSTPTPGGKRRDVGLYGVPVTR